MQKVTVQIELNEDTLELIQMWIRDYGSPGKISPPITDVAQLAVMLLEDVGLAMRRPGSWEGANMWHVLHAHGYGLL